MSDLTERLIALQDELDGDPYVAGTEGRDTLAEAVNTLTEQEAENARLRDELERLVGAVEGFLSAPRASYGPHMTKLAYVAERARRALSDSQEGRE